jgi:hypothetical protein
MTNTHDTKKVAKDEIYKDVNAKDIVNGQVVDRDVSKSTNPRFNKGAFDTIEEYVENLNDEEVRMEVRRLTSDTNIKDITKEAGDLQDPVKNKEYLLKLKKEELRG